MQTHRFVVGDLSCKSPDRDSLRSSHKPPLMNLLKQIQILKKLIPLEEAAGRVDLYSKPDQATDMLLVPMLLTCDYSHGYGHERRASVLPQTKCGSWRPILFVPRYGLE